MPECAATIAPNNRYYHLYHKEQYSKTLATFNARAFWKMQRVAMHDLTKPKLKTKSCEFWKIIMIFNRGKPYDMTFRINFL